MALSLVPEALADYLRWHEEDLDSYDPAEDGLFDAEPGLLDELETIAA